MSIMRGRLHIAAFAALALLALAAAPAQAMTSVTGVWSVADGKAEITIRECGETLCGRLINARKIEANPDIIDKKNRNPSLRPRKLKGILVLTGFVSGGPAQWKNGSIYNPDDGGTYRATMKQIDDDTLKVAGCIVWPLCKSTRLKRIRSDAVAGFDVAEGAD
ncbi:MAG: hypothetical protein B7Y99_12490 [Caulobacterales bacterium 32-69-10]|nr:MAG: hypothetical protein B7Y99_12490 [Caulobacterales bacterium 32-69-10]